jgi:transcriptional regulator with XRE-family HTH domain
MPEITSGNIRDLRSALSLSQEALARRLKVSTAAVRAWEAGRRNPRGLYRDALLRLMRQHERQSPAGPAGAISGGRGVDGVDNEGTDQGALDDA